MSVLLDFRVAVSQVALLLSNKLECAESKRDNSLTKVILIVELGDDSFIHNIPPVNEDSLHLVELNNLRRKLCTTFVANGLKPEAEELGLVSDLQL